MIVCLFYEECLGKYKIAKAVLETERSAKT